MEEILTKPKLQIDNTIIFILFFSEWKTLLKTGKKKKKKHMTCKGGAM